MNQYPRGSRNTPSRFIRQKSEISAGLMGLWLAHFRFGADFTFFLGGIDIYKLACISQTCMVT